MVIGAMLWPLSFGVDMNKYLSALILSGVCAGCSSAPVERKMERKISSVAADEATENEIYPTVELTEGMREEDRRKGVIYWNAEKREASQVTIRAGKVFDANGSPFRDSRSNHDNQIGYVMDQGGFFYFFNGYADPTLRHSSVFAGKDVAGAGDMVIEKGKIVYVDSNSDHYRTKPIFKNVLIRLRQLGVPTGKCIRRQTVECRPGSTDPKEN
jgi:hypothetical protein